MFVLFFLRAEDEGRTRDIQLGRLTLYQLSYFRILRFSNLRIDFSKSGRRGSNSRHSAWKADALPTELLPHFTIFKSPFDFGDANIGILKYVMQDFFKKYLQIFI